VPAAALGSSGGRSVSTMGQAQRCKLASLALPHYPTAARYDRDEKERGQPFVRAGPFQI